MTITAPRPHALSPNVIEHFYRGGERIAALRGRRAHQQVWTDRYAALRSGWHRRLPGGAPTGSGLTELGPLGPLHELVAADPDALARGGPRRPLGAVAGAAGQVARCRRAAAGPRPSRTASSPTTHLGCPFGKTEAWVVLDVPPEVARCTSGRSARCAARSGPSSSTPRRWTRCSSCSGRSRIDVGDGVVVPASTPHCLDAGVFVVELQEPTDFSILLEWDGFEVDGLADGHLGLGFPTALGAVRTDALSTADVDELVRRAALPDDGIRALLPPAADPYFRAWAVDLAPGAQATVPAAFSAVVVTDGSGTLRWADGRSTVCQGRRARRAARRRPTDIRRRRSRRHGRRRPTTVAGCSRTGREGRAVSRDVLIGIDVGTTRVKVVIVDLTGAEVAAAAVGYAVGRRWPSRRDGRPRPRRCRAHGHRRRSRPVQRDGRRGRGTRR